MTYMVMATLAFAAAIGAHMFGSDEAWWFLALAGYLRLCQIAERG